MAQSEKESSCPLNDRQQIGQRTGIVGIAINALLFAMKCAVGLFSNSVSILVDGFNNLTDCASALVTIIGFRFCSKETDDKHPYGYGRMEYVSGFIVSFLIIGTAFSFGKTAIMRMVHPEELRIVSWFLLVPVFSIVMKLALAFYIHLVNRMMNSAVLRATFKDSLADAAVTSITLISLLTTPYTQIPLDGIAGLIIALVILWSGITSFLENLDLLLGEGADRDLTQRVIRTVLEESLFGGVEAFALYDFGPEKQVVFLQVSLNASPHLERVQSAIKDLTASLKQEFNLEATIYWNVSHTETALEGEEHGSDQYHRIQGELFENDITH